MSAYWITYLNFVSSCDSMGVESCFDLFEPEVRVCFIKCRKFCDIPFYVRRSCATIRPWHLGVILCHFESFFFAKVFLLFRLKNSDVLGWKMSSCSSVDFTGLILVLLVRRLSLCGTRGALYFLRVTNYR